MAISGIDCVVRCATGASATFSSVDGVKNFSVSDSRNLLDVTDFADSDIHARIAGLRDFSLTLSGDAELLDTGYRNLRAAYDASTAAFIGIMPFGNNTAAFTYKVMVESIELSAGVDGTVEISISTMANGLAPYAITGT